MLDLCCSLFCGIPVLAEEKQVHPGKIMPVPRQVNLPPESAGGFFMSIVIEGGEMA